MKKFLITGGILFAIMPAMALDLTDMYIPEDTGDCSGTEFQNNSVTMQAIYVTDSCPAGQYFNVGANATVDSTTGQITDASCQPCTNGHYCPSSTSITVNSNGILESQGAQECLAGTYADSDRTSLTACDACPAGTYQTQTGQSSCTQARQGYYIADATQVDVECPVGYRNGAVGTGTSEANCVKTVDAAYCASLNLCSNFNNIITSGTGACTTSVNTNNGNIINGAITYGNRSTEPLCIVNKTCKPGYSPTNMYAWVVAHPEGLSGNIPYCSPGGNGAGCATMEPGTVTFTVNDDTGIPIDKIHYVTICNDKTTDDFSTNVVASATAEAAGFSTTNTGANCWLRNIDAPNQPWMYLNYSSFIPNASHNSENCARFCGLVPAVSQDYMLGTMQDGNFTLLLEEFVEVFSVAATLTNGKNGNPTADVCVASEITINWGKDSENQDITTTCTYGEGNEFTAPTTTPVAPADGLKFIGWRISPANNN